MMPVNVTPQLDRVLKSLFTPLCSACIRKEARVLALVAEELVKFFERATAACMITPVWVITGVTLLDMPLQLGLRHKRGTTAFLSAFERLFTFVHEHVAVEMLPSRKRCITVGISTAKGLLSRM